MRPHPVVAGDVVRRVRGRSPGLLDDVDPEASFDEMDLDSLVLVELSVVISEEFGLEIEDWELAEAGCFQQVARMIEARRQPGEAD